MFRHINGHKTDITIFIDEKPTNASSGETVAAVLLREIFMQFTLRQMVRLEALIA